MGHHLPLLEFTNGLKSRKNYKVRAIDPLKCHHPAEMYGTDVTLFYPGFDTFVQQCRSVKLVSEDTTFVTKFSIELSKNYDNERSRNVIVQNFLGNYLLGYPMVSSENTGGAVICGRSFCLIFETMCYMCVYHNDDKLTSTKST